MGFHVVFSAWGELAARRVLCESRFHWLHEGRDQAGAHIQEGPRGGAQPGAAEAAGLPALTLRTESSRAGAVPGLTMLPCLSPYPSPCPSPCPSLCLSPCPSPCPSLHGLLWNSYISPGEFYPEFSRPQMGVWWDGRGRSGRTVATVAEFEETPS